MAHDCWFCKTMRGIVVAGFSAYAVVGMIALVQSAHHRQWAWVGKEALGVLICLAMIPIGLTVLKVYSRALDKI